MRALCGNLYLFSLQELDFSENKKCKTSGVQEASYFDQFNMTEKGLEYDQKYSHQRT